MLLVHGLQAYDEDTNRFDNGYPNGGNYWSNYNGTDSYSGPYQNETGSDGIGDTPYPIQTSNEDSYPFMQQNSWEPYDISEILERINQFGMP
ncbi:hypothetical protein J7L60_04670 [Candidatus Bathyarchaeota archaeon]|nr:hypothetical protein [Candidatus Bathyarchaeota archaeon]